IMRSLIFMSILFLAFTACDSGTGNDNEQVHKETAVDSVAHYDKVVSPPNELYKDTTIAINTFAELYRHIGSNRTLIIKAKEISMNSMEKLSGNVHIELDPTMGMMVRGVSNMRIMGDEGTIASLVQPNPGSRVIYFAKCDNILFENIKAGHAPEKGYCAATVLQFDECKNIFVSKSQLYGSGYEGITVFRCRNVYCSDTKIYGCSFRILSLTQSQDVKFMNCRFVDNNEPLGSGSFYLSGNESVIFNGGEIANNARYMKNPNDEPFFNIEDCDDIVIKGTYIHHNTAKKFSSTTDDIKLVEVKMENNTWQQDETALR
ncbi:MAG: right-handed parallel beta-helix repeat-containing protein, partial [Bacteroidota bacterium]|nr:right-handed parallel beta-helix repeat-containing protein [Bacteroidota bacterium]